jgi:hypothetical protein
MKQKQKQKGKAEKGSTQIKEMGNKKLGALGSGALELRYKPKPIYYI